MASQFKGLYQAKIDRMSAYLDIVRSFTKQFVSVTTSLKPRNDIWYADVLVYLVVTSKDDSPR